MDEAEFWKLIDSAKLAAASAQKRPQELRGLLELKGPSEILVFYELYIDQIKKAYRWDLWGAAYVISGGCSDDGFDYFRDWLISEGKEVFERALSDPETLSELPFLEEPELEEMRYVADELYEKKSGKSMMPRQRQHQSDPAGEPWDEDTVAPLFPKLAQVYG